tara:strand:+ start:3265 stop:3477 length:213 start_codon:yes stop_codon:yes gene_type:complete
MGNNMKSFLNLKYSELEILKDLIKLYMQSDGKVIEDNWHNNNANTNIFHNEVIEISNKITVSLTNQYRED